MSSMLIISGHPDLNHSVANRTILEELTKAFPQADMRQLDKLYPDYHIDIEAEQKALLKADLIIWQFPFYWYAMPALMKKWLDDVFTYGFAHGSSTKLAGKRLFLSFTTGAPADAYHSNGISKHCINDYLTAFKTTADLCDLVFIPPSCLNGVSYVGRNAQMIQQQLAEAKAYAFELIQKIHLFYA
ncbi:NAD(P)H-dependent oxidoreductase [Pelistega sp. NLN82]|uniref:NAD(P)H-dependent oxidoreductase n=1 Tax=Pelistega ratti TaxID=2652177 RepID=A0A6L9Y872_9BURK|nr:NAD(P)H-dependent oxidoreductase [Pelistega ratti]NEN76405.1 NAD(P)H-dependent oxidoreductase [Pelistega ratti]